MACSKKARSTYGLMSKALILTTVAQCQLSVAMHAMPAGAYRFHFFLWNRKI